MNCCVECFAEREIKTFIEYFDTIGDCDFCGSTGINVAETSEVAEFIKEGVERVYEAAANCVAWDEGAYQLPTIDIEDILEEWDVFSERLDDPTDLLHSFNFDNIPYVRQDPYGPLSGGREAITNWKEFCDRVKRHQRFTILLPTAESDVTNINGEEHPSTFIAEIASWMNQELGSLIPPPTVIYRARAAKSNERFGHLDLTSPPSSLAGNNRLSPAGISFFYGALDVDTAIAEVRPSLGDIVTVGSFEVCKLLSILDFSMIPSSTSPFNDMYAFRFEEFILPFLEHFAEDISKPIRFDDALIDYVPTQIYTEYVTFSSGRNGPLDGLVYKSSMKNGGKCVALFRGQDISTVGDCQDNNTWLRYKAKSNYHITGVNFQHSRVANK